MHFIDMWTVVLGQGLVNLACGLMLGLLYWHNRRRYQGLALWMWAFLLQAAGIGLMLTRGLTPDLVSVVLSNLAGMAGLVLLHRGLLAFWGKRAAPLPDLGILAGFLAVHIYFTYSSPSVAARIVNVNFWLALMLARCARGLYFSAPAQLRGATRGTVLALAGFAAVALARIAVALAGGGSAEQDFFSHGAPDAALLFVFQIVTVMLTMALFLLVNRRLLADTRADYEGRVEAEHALSGALKAARLGTWSWNVKTNRLAWSEEMYRIFGLPPETFSGDLPEVVSRVIHPDDKAMVEESNRSVSENGRPKAAEYRVLWPDGSVRWVRGEASEFVKDAEGRPELLKGYAQDITARKQDEGKLRESADRLQLALASAGMGLWQWDVRKDHRHFDDKVCELLGLDKNTFSGSTAEFFAVVHPEDLPLVKEALARTLREDVLYSPHYRAVWPDGSVHHISSRGRLRRGEKGSPLVLDGMLWDVTERVLAENSMRSAQKLESLGALAGGIAHDFNNLLTGITGSLSLLAGRMGKDEELAGILREADHACAAAKGLARQMLTFAAGGKPLMKPLDLVKLARESAEFSLRGSGVRLDFHGDREVVVLGDREQLFQAVQNLVLNAAQAMGGNGSIKVAVSAAALNGAGVGELAVSDTGKGMPAAVQERLFEPYFSTKGQGRGLGLAVCRSIALKHGGSIRVDTREGDGSVFAIRLPLTAERPADTGRRKAAAPAPAGGRVLVMDDEEIVYKALTRMLTSLGYRAEVAVNGEAAVEALRAALAAGDPFGTVILDLTISGGMGGAEAVKKLKGLDPSVKAVVSSGYSDDPVMANCAAHGFDAALPKPFRLEEVEQALQALIARPG